jgi:outer membrane protein assembly factor BamC
MEQSNQDKSLFDSFLFWRDEDETDLSKDKKSSSVRDQVDEEKTNNGTDDSNVEESTDTDEKLFSEKSWDEKFPIRKFWGSDEEKKPDDEFRYRVRISPMDEFTKVYLDLPNGSLNNSEESQQIIKIIFEQLK